MADEKLPKPMREMLESPTEFEKQFAVEPFMRAVEDDLRIRGSERVVLKSQEQELLEEFERELALRRGEGVEGEENDAHERSVAESKFDFFFKRSTSGSGPFFTRELMTKLTRHEPKLAKWIWKHLVKPGGFDDDCDADVLGEVERLRVEAGLPVEDW